MKEDKLIRFGEFWIETVLFGRGNNTTQFWEVFLKLIKNVAVIFGGYLKYRWHRIRYERAFIEIFGDDLRFVYIWGEILHPQPLTHITTWKIPTTMAVAGLEELKERYGWDAEIRVGIFGIGSEDIQVGLKPLKGFEIDFYMTSKRDCEIKFEKVTEEKTKITATCFDGHEGVKIG